VLHRADAAPAGIELVTFLEFDQELLATRYRAAEQALWLLVRAARVVGGRRRGGRVLVQTRVPITT
jgi:primosomal protein N' (replication factor Y)